ncbi:MAG: glucose-fructose oxidoreductase [Robiginitomaculum sp.]|nr:MAG: glucose-fructose oxidoreductase [Robiginitomaculum sp.]
MTDFHHSRRRFMQLSGAALIAPPLLTGCSPAQAASSPASLPRKAIGMPFPSWGRLPDTIPPAPKEDSVGFAVVGLGGYAIGQVMPALAKAGRCHVAAVVSGNPDKAARVASAYGLPKDAIYNYDNFDELAKDDRVDAIYIVLPTGLHADWTEKAFAVGKHVLCEKPMALSPQEGERMISASKRAGRKLMIAYRCHFEPYNLHAMDLMRDKAVGTIKTIETFQHYRMGPTSPSENWRVVRSLAGGGALEDYGIYGLQAALYLSGETPSHIRAVTEQPAGDPRFAEIFASVRTEMQFPSGATASLFTSYDSAPGRNRVSVHGDAGTLLMDPATGYGGHKMTLTQGGKAKVLKPGDPSVQFSRQCAHFADAILDDVEIRTPGEMGLRDIRLIDAIYTSAAEDRVVTL